MSKYSLIAAGFLALAFLGGCRHQESAEARHEKRPAVPFFAPEDQPRDMDHVLAAQAAAGARDDATLYATDFDGDQLSETGRAKLYLMSGTRSTTRPVIYLNMEQSDARREAVEAFMRDGGSSVAQVKFGANPDRGAAVSDGLAGLRRLQAPDKTSSPAGGGNSMTNSGGMGGSSSSNSAR